jgi:hypothetical protein
VYDVRSANRSPRIRWRQPVDQKPIYFLAAHELYGLAHFGAGVNADYVSGHRLLSRRHDPASSSSFLSLLILGHQDTRQLVRVVPPWPFFVYYVAGN